jgi:hypothetical protein
VTAFLSRLRNIFHLLNYLQVATNNQTTKVQFNSTHRNIKLLNVLFIYLLLTIRSVKHDIQENMCLQIIKIINLGGKPLALTSRLKTQHKIVPQNSAHS